jgi:hypothetical protein
MVNRLCGPFLHPFGAKISADPISIISRNLAEEQEKKTRAKDKIRYQVDFLELKDRLNANREWPLITCYYFFKFNTNKGGENLIK